MCHPLGWEGSGGRGEKGSKGLVGPAGPVSSGMAKKKLPTLLSPLRHGSLSLKGATAVNQWGVFVSPMIQAS